jgi:hypothetical protein
MTERADPIWPDRWQPEAIAAATPYVDADDRLDILVDDPQVALSGTRLGGYLFRGDDGAVTIIHDRSGEPDVYPWRLLRGPVLVIKLLRPGRRAVELYRHPLWQK